MNTHNFYLNFISEETDIKFTQFISGGDRV